MVESFKENFSTQNLNITFHLIRYILPGHLSTNHKFKIFAL